MKMNLRTFFILALLVALPASASAADYTIKMKSRQFTPGPVADLTLELNRFAGSHVLIQLHQTPNLKTRQNLKDQGITLLKPISGTDWISRVENRKFKSSDKLTALRWVGAILPTDKIHPALQEGRVYFHSLFQDGRRVLDVGMHADVNEQQGRSVLAGFDATVLDYARTTNSYIVALDLDDHEALAAKDDVVWISEAGPALTPTLDVARVTVGADVANEPPYSVTGEGVVAFVLDGGTMATGNKSHPDLAGRVTVAGFAMPDVIGHPTHVGCIVGGDGTASGGLYKGMAPDVQIISSTVIPSLSIPALYDKPGNMENAYETAITQHHATVANNSIGSNLATFGAIFCDKEGDYERTAQLVDSIVNEKFGRITIVWANGNERGGACGSAYNTTAPPSTAKNPITVGATNKEDNSMADFSSWGPTDDGRIRPDISAPGCTSDYEGIISCGGPFSSQDYIGFCGTSMACPVVTGSVALIQQYWRDKLGTEDPWASTVKGLVIHGAEPVGDDGPDYRYGYGLLYVPNSLDLIDNAGIIQDQVDQGDAFTTTMQANGDPVKVTLVWTDPAGEHLAAKVLVNDLDLTLHADSQTEKPWILDPANPSASATRGENHLDPVEQITASFAAGDWVDVVVTATEVPEGPQKFSLIITGLEGGDDDDDNDDNDNNDDNDDDDSSDDDDDNDDDDGCGC